MGFLRVRQPNQTRQPVGLGVRYMFVSNSDNLGATMDLKILTHFVNSGVSALSREGSQATVAAASLQHMWCLFGLQKAFFSTSSRDSSSCYYYDYYHHHHYYYCYSPCTVTYARRPIKIITNEHTNAHTHTQASSQRGQCPAFARLLS